MLYAYLEPLNLLDGYSYPDGLKPWLALHFCLAIFFWALHYDFMVLTELYVGGMLKKETNKPKPIQTTTTKTNQKSSVVTG